MLGDRQRRLLALLDTLGGQIGALDFQKLLFLFGMEEGVSMYEFVPYRFGAFSFTSYADKRRLIEGGFLNNDEQAWKLTEAGRTAATVLPSERLKMKRFCERYAQLRGDALVRESYRRYPYFAIRSDIAARLLREDKSALAAIDAIRPVRATPGLCTIGYEGRSLEGYLNRLIRAGVTLLCDVRRNPLSRKYGFAKSTLAKSCEGTGIRYEHLPELGVSSEDRQHLETQEDYETLFTRYERETLPIQQSALDTIHQWIQQGERVALTCFEAEPLRCHRHCVADALHRLHGQNLAPLHL